MPDEVFRLINEIQGMERVRELTEQYRKEEQVAIDLRKQLIALGQTQDQIAANPAFRAIAENLVRTRNEIHAVERSSGVMARNFGNSMYMLQATIEDAQYGIRAVANNLPLLFSEFGRQLGISNTTAMSLGALAGLVAMNIQIWTKNADDFRRVMQDIGFGPALDAISSKVRKIGEDLKVWTAGGTAPSWFRQLEDLFPVLGAARQGYEAVSPRVSGMTAETIRQVEEDNKRAADAAKERAELAKSTEGRLKEMRATAATERGEDFTRALRGTPGGAEQLAERMIRERMAGMTPEQLNKIVRLPGGEEVTTRERIRRGVYEAIGHAMKGDEAFMGQVFGASETLKQQYEAARALRAEKTEYEQRVSEAEGVIGKIKLNSQDQDEIQRLKEELARTEKDGNAAAIRAAKKAYLDKVEQLMGLAPLAAREEQDRQAFNRRAEEDLRRQVEDQQIRERMELQDQNPNAEEMAEALVSGARGNLRTANRRALNAYFAMGQASLRSRGGMGRQLLGRQYRMAVGQMQLGEALEDFFLAETPEARQTVLDRVGRMSPQMRQQFNVMRNQYQMMQRMGLAPTNEEMRAQIEFLKATNRQEAAVEKFNTAVDKLLNGNIQVTL